jgi:hypothetical protein
MTQVGLVWVHTFDAPPRLHPMTPPHGWLAELDEAGVTTYVWRRPESEVEGAFKGVAVKALGAFTTSGRAVLIPRDALRTLDWRPISMVGTPTSGFAWRALERSVRHGFWIKNARGR